MRIALSLAAVSALMVGCNKSEPGGAPGTANTFKLDLPVIPERIKQDTSEIVKVKLDRGKDFKQNVKLKATVSPDKGVKTDFEPKDTVAAADPAEANLKLTVAKDAPVGEYTVTVTGTPDTGSPTTKDFKVKVTAP